MCSGCEGRMDILSVRVSQALFPIRQIYLMHSCLRPFARFGLIPFGGRSTAIKLKDGGVWVLASTPLDEETKNTIDNLGPVKRVWFEFYERVKLLMFHWRFIVSPDAVHYLFLGVFWFNAPFWRCSSQLGMFNWLTLNQANSRKPTLARSWLLRREQLNARAISPSFTMEVSAISVFLSFFFEFFKITDTVWGRDPPGTKYGFEDDARTLLSSLYTNISQNSQVKHWYFASPSWWLDINVAWMRIDSYFSGFKNKDIAFFHEESKSLIEADLLLNLPCKEQVKFHL